MPLCSRCISFRFRCHPHPRRAPMRPSQCKEWRMGRARVVVRLQDGLTFGLFEWLG
jgi:hypothetical protein